MLKVAIGLVIVISFLFIGCEKKKKPDTKKDFELLTPVNPELMGDRLFGVTVTDNRYGFESAFNRAKEAGIQVVELNIPWNAIEIAKGQYVDPMDHAFVSSYFYGVNNIKVELSLALINTVEWEIPDYLNMDECNSEEFLDAFKNMIDWVLDTIPDNVIVPSISIGNEIDLVLQTQEEWDKYITFYDSASTYIQQKYPHIKAGVKITVMDGVFSDQLKNVKRINQNSDVVMLNYYPKNQLGEVLDPEIVKTHFDQLANLFKDKPIWFTEIGYQSGSEMNKSSEERQAAFFHHMFTAYYKFL